MKKALLPLFVFACLATFGQKTDKEFGDKYFDKFDYAVAMESYLMAYEGNTQDAEVTRKIGLCLRKLGSIDESAEWFKRTLDMDDSNTLDMLHYAEALKSKEDYSKAVFWYSRYAMANPYDQRTQSHIRDPKYFHDLKADSLKYFLKKLDINTEKPSFGVSAFEGGYLFSTSGVKTYGNTIDDLPYLDIYMCQKNEADEFVEAMPLKGKINSKYHDGPAYYDPNSQTIFVTRNNVKNGRPVYDANGSVNLKVYAAKEANGKWNEISELPFNSNEYSTGHPSLNADGTKMYFVSNMPGGFGGTDIYVTEKTPNGWGEPFNCGPEVNSEGNEMFPFVSQEGKLYFSSDGHAGLGGLDIFHCVPVGENFLRAENLGFPINSAHDDFGVMYEDDKQSGYFSSNRDGKGRDDLFFFSTLEYMKQIFAGTIESDLPQNQLIGEELTVFVSNRGEYLSTTIQEDLSFQVEVESGDELEFFLGGREYAHGVPFFTHNVEEKLEDTYHNEGTIFIQGNKVSKYAEPTAVAMENSDDLSNKMAEDSSNALMQAMMDLKNSSEVLVEDSSMMEEVENADTSLSSRLDGLNNLLEIEDLTNILFGFDSASLTKESKAQLDNLIRIMNDHPELIVQISTHTDSRGSKEYNQYLSKKRARAVQTYLQVAGILESQVILTWHGEDSLANSCTDGSPCDESLHKLNRRAEFAFMTEEMAQAYRTK